MLSFIRLKNISILLLSLLLLQTCKGKSGSTIEIRVMTYNVAGLPEGLSSSHPDSYTSSIGPLLNDVDIVHVQEDFCYHDSLLLGANHPYISKTLGCVPHGDGLNTFSRFPVSDPVRFAWKDCTGFDCFTPKGFYFSRVRFQEGFEIDFYNVHCNAGSTEESMKARRGNIAQLGSFILKHSEGNAVIVMGDFNCRYTRAGDSIRAFSAMGFSDVWIELIRNGNVPELGSDKLDNCDPLRTSSECERVDKVFYRSSPEIEITPVSYQLDDSRYYYRGNDSLTLSDHWPVFGQFQIRY